MRQLVILLLLCVLPLQFVLASSVDARVHAEGGHHHVASSHSHETTTESVSDDLNADDSSVRSHSESGGCHHHHHSVAVLGESADFTRPPSFASGGPANRTKCHGDAAGERPERPNWSALV